MKRIGEIFDSLSSKNDVFKELKLRMVLADLKDLLGESLARHCRFIEFSGGTLHFECDDQVWLMEANFMRRKLVEKVRQVLPDQQVNDVIFRRCRQ
ncbi:MAG: DUF721 domain-containing protein [Pseudothermotoga sp.]